MPTYQYACNECGNKLEAVQSFSDDPLTVCPACEGKLRKVFSSVGVVFKGSGFYRTDSRAASTAAETAKSESSTTSSGSSATGSSSTGSTGNGSKSSEGSSSSSSGAGSSSAAPAAKSA
ncbi:MAG: hypothetical protein QOI35_1734 [Cryptosporangiaceae bacterium]|nr:hypothetical protein [Cryptosporangiaceae bacterium]MDQ1658783.1 hypothetical protein [Cryptosporangiaceae bacterium]